MAIKLSDADKKTLTDAFNEAVNKSPDADTPTTMLSADGSETTFRAVVEKGLKDGTIFKNIEMMLNNMPVSLDEIVAETKKVRFALPKQPKP